jgi:hypothetical protein
MQTMKCIKRARWVAPAVLGVALLLGFVPPADLANTSHAANPTRNVAELTAMWWQWVAGIPASQSPLLDATGEFAGVGQPYKGSKVFFLAGVNGSGSAERSINVPQGTALFFPLVNVFFIDSIGRGRDPVNNPTVPQLYAIVKAQVDTVHDLHVTLDDVSLLDSAQRVVSPPFAFKLPKDNIFGAVAPAGEYAPGVSDGYWFYLPALPPGNYDLKFGGIIDALNASIDITYHITVE